MPIRSSDGTEKALELLNQLERTLQQKQNLHIDFSKLKTVLEDPAFRFNVNVQKSLSELKDKLDTSTPPTISSSSTEGFEGDFTFDDQGNLRVKTVELVNRKNAAPSYGDSTMGCSTSGNTAVEEAGKLNEAHFVKKPRKCSSNNESEKVINVDIPLDQTKRLGWILGEKNGNIFVINITPDGPIFRNGQIEIGDQLLTIDGHVVGGGRGLSVSKVIEVIQESDKSFVQLSLAKSADRSSSLATFQSEVVSRKSSTALNTEGENNMVLHGEWTQIQVLELENDGSGLGFGIVGGRSTGVVVKTILPGGSAGRDGRLRPGDHLLQINNIHLHGMSSEQVAMILRQEDRPVVKLVVGRPVDITSPHPSHSSWQESELESKSSSNRGAFTVPTKVATDRLALDRHITEISAAGSSDQPQTSSEQFSPAATAATDLPSDQLSKLTFNKENRKPDEFDLLEVIINRDRQIGLGITVGSYVFQNDQCVPGPSTQHKRAVLLKRLINFDLPK